MGITAVKKGSRTWTGPFKVANKMEAATGVHCTRGEGSSGTPHSAAAVAAAAVKRAVGTPSNHG